MKSSLVFSGIYCLMETASSRLRNLTIHSECNFMLLAHVREDNISLKFDQNLHRQLTSLSSIRLVHNKLVSNVFRTVDRVGKGTHRYRRQSPPFNPVPSKVSFNTLCHFQSSLCLVLKQKKKRVFFHVSYNCSQAAIVILLLQSRAEYNFI